MDFGCILVQTCKKISPISSHLNLMPRKYYLLFNHAQLLWFTIQVGLAQMLKCCQSFDFVKLRGLWQSQGPQINLWTRQLDFLDILTYYFHFPLDTQSDPDFSIVARVEAFIAGWGLDEALKRSEAYLNAGADAILMHSKKSDPSDIEAFVKAWNNQVHFMIYIFFSWSRGWFCLLLLTIGQIAQQISCPKS